MEIREITVEDVSETVTEEVDTVAETIVDVTEITPIIVHDATSGKNVTARSFEENVIVRFPRIIRGVHHLQCQETSFHIWR